MRGWYEFNEDWNAYNAKNLNGCWRLNSSYLSYESRVHIQESGTEYWSATYIGASAIKLRAYNNSSNGSFDGNFSDLRDRVDISPHQITMGQTGNLTSPDWDNKIGIYADGAIHCDSLYAQGNIYIASPHVINSNDGGDLYFESGIGSENSLITIHASGFSQSSTLESKTNVELMDTSKSLDRVLNTDVVSFQYLSELGKGINKTHSGFAIGGGYNLPELYQSVKQDGVLLYDPIGDLFAAVQELNKLHQEDIVRIAELESKVN
jgi:hypothetical protein